MKKITSRQMALNGLVAGLYAAVTILTASFAYGNIQFRIAEALCPLVALEPSLTIGLTLGCLIARWISSSARRRRFLPAFLRGSSKKRGRCRCRRSSATC